MLTLRDTPQQMKERTAIRSWIESHLPERLRWVTDFEDALELDRLLAHDGLLAPAWPVELGGRGLAADLQLVINQELEAAGVQRAKSPSHQGVNNLAPALIRHGTPEQKCRYLPGILAVEDIWCQGFSEPDAGSDLASLRTSARLDGDDLVVNGGKIWTSGAEHATFIFLLVRTGLSEERHKGLTFLLAPMGAPGISFEPIEQIVGGSDFCSVRLDDVRIARSGVVGGIGGGWAVTMTLLAAERLSGRHRYGSIKREVAELAGLVAGGAQTPALAGDVAVRNLGRLVAEVEGIGALARRIESMAAAGLDPGPLPSINKLWWPAVHQRLAEEGLARADIESAAVWYERWLSARPESIYGGTAQIQRNIIAERTLGLPR